MISFLYHCQDFYRTWLYILVTGCMSYKKKELLVICEHLKSFSYFFWWGSRSSYLYLFVLSYYVPLRSASCVVISHKNYVRFVFTSSCLWKCSFFIHVIYVCLHIVVSNEYCVVFLLCLSACCVPYVARFSRLSIIFCPFGFI